MIFTVSSPAVSRSGLRSRQRKADNKVSQEDGRPPIKMKFKINNINASPTTEQAVIKLKRLSVSKEIYKDYKESLVKKKW